MNARTVGYWIATGLVVLGFVPSGFADLAHAAPIVEGLTDHLGYPLYFLGWLGFWKVLGAVALVTPDRAAPWVPRVKEWAYAGYGLTMLGGIYSHLMVGDGITPPLVVLLVALVASYALRAGVPAASASGVLQR